MVVEASDSEKRLGIEQCNHGERQASFWSELVSCVLELYNDLLSNLRMCNLRVLLRIGDIGNMANRKRG